MKVAKQKRSKTAAPTPVAAAAARPVPAFWFYVLGAVAAFVATFVVYEPAMNGPFILDDLYLPFMSPNYPTDLHSWIQGVRPLLMFSFWINFQSGVQDTHPFHLWNVLFHAADSVMIFLIVRKILQWAKTETKLATLLAIFAAGIFLLHPVQTESVAYIASRSEVLSVLLFNIAFAIFLYRKADSVSIPGVIAILVLFAAAVSSKEHTAVLPLLLLLTDYFWNPGFALSGVKRNWKLYVPIALGGLIIIRPVIELVRHSTTAGFALKTFTWQQYFATQCRMIWEYMRLFVLPFGLNLDPDVRVSYSLLDPTALAGFVGLVALSVAAWYYRKRFSVAAYGWFTFLLLLAPTSSVMPIADVYAERRIYLPFIGLLLVTVELLRRWQANRTTLIAALGVILLVEAGLTYQRSEMWGSAISLWKDAAAKSPKKLRPNFQLAKAYFDAGQFSESTDQYARTAQIQPPDYALLVDWAEALQGIRQYDQAIEKLKQAAQMHPSGHIYAEMGKEYGLKGDYDEALKTLDMAEKLDGTYAMTYVYRGMALASQGKKEEAEKQYLRGLQLDPRNPVAPGLLENLRKGR